MTTAPKDEFPQERSSVVWQQIRRAVNHQRNDAWAQGVRIGVAIGRTVAEGRTRSQARKDLLLPILIAAAVAVLLGFAIGHADAHAAAPRPAQDIPATEFAEVSVGVPSSESDPGRTMAPQSLLPSPWPTIPEVVLPTSGPSLEGTATWYCNSDARRARLSRCHYRYPDGPGVDLFAAAGHRLQRLIGPHWRGSVVQVTSAAGVPVWVRLIDSCACAGDHEIDLYLDAFTFLAERGRVNPATVTW